jgi:hypothetical protein
LVSDAPTIHGDVVATVSESHPLWPCRRAATAFGLNADRALRRSCASVSSNARVRSGNASQRWSRHGSTGCSIRLFHCGARWTFVPMCGPSNKRSKAKAARGPRTSLCTGRAGRSREPIASIPSRRAGFSRHLKEMTPAKTNRGVRCEASKGQRK